VVASEAKGEFDLPYLPRLKQEREKRLLSQQELADRAGLRQSTIWRLEAQETQASFKTVRALIAALGITDIRELTGEQDG
jgi:ribosome-binding protein aMBF1 (putative translation factor)